MAALVYGNPRYPIGVSKGSGVFGGNDGWDMERRLSPKTPDPIYLSRQVRCGNLAVQVPASPATAGAKNRLVCNGFSNCLWRLKDENKGELLLWKAATSLIFSPVVFR